MGERGGFTWRREREREGNHRYVRRKVRIRTILGFLLSSRNSRTHTCNQERYAAALATGNSALACEDQTKVWRKLVSMRGAKLADPARHTRFVCAIVGLSRRATIRGLRKKILGWCESALCA